MQGRRFIIKTDHQSLIYLKYQNLIDSTRVARWLDFLSNFDYEIQYISGSQNFAADALSRYPYEVNFIDVFDEKIIELEVEDGESMSDDFCNTVTVMELNEKLKERIIQSYQKDKSYELIYDTLKHKKDVPKSIHHHIKHYEFVDGLLYYRTLLEDDFSRLEIPGNLVHEFISNAHCGFDSNHPGIWKTYSILRKSFHWERMLKSVKRFVTKCVICQKSKAKHST